MTVPITLYLLVKDNKIIFGPRRYYKPAFVKVLTDNGIDLELPESIDAMTTLANGYSLVPEHEVANLVQAQVVEPEPEVVVQVQVVEPEPEVVLESTKKRKSYGYSNN